MNYNDLSIEQLKVLLAAKEAERDAKANLEQVITNLSPAPIPTPQVAPTKPLKGRWRFTSDDLKQMKKDFIYFTNGNINSKATTAAFLGRPAHKCEYVQFMQVAQGAGLPISRRNRY